jgi:hypothetical protein
MRAFFLVFLVLATLAAVARADDPKFEYGKKEAAKGVEWKASAQAGLLLTTGNARSTAFSGSLAASRKAGSNKVSLDVTGAFARSAVLIANDLNNDGMIEQGELSRQETTTTKNWLAKLRYDRFFGASDSLFLTGRLGQDEPAGKSLFGGAQAGYSRVLHQDAVNKLVGEVGYDLTHEDYLAGGDGLTIHSARLFLGYDAALSPDTGFSASIEALLNLNTESTPTGDASALEDTRGTGKVSLTTKLHKNVSFRFSLTAKYDNYPAPLPAFALPFATGFVPVADKYDGITEVALIVNFI